jgi:hypothetical protein
MPAAVQASCGYNKDSVPVPVIYKHTGTWSNSIGSSDTYTFDVNNVRNQINDNPDCYSGVGDGVYQNDVLVSNTIMHFDSNNVLEDGAHTIVTVVMDKSSPDVINPSDGYQLCYGKKYHDKLDKKPYMDNSFQNVANPHRPIVCSAPFKVVWKTCTFNEDEINIGQEVNKVIGSSVDDVILELGNIRDQINAETHGCFSNRLNYVYGSTSSDKNTVDFQLDESSGTRTILRVTKRSNSFASMEMRIGYGTTKDTVVYSAPFLVRWNTETSVCKYATPSVPFLSRNKGSGTVVFQLGDIMG